LQKSIYLIQLKAADGSEPTLSDRHEVFQTLLLAGDFSGGGLDGA
jgi:hypothetical protein